MLKENAVLKENELADTSTVSCEKSCFLKYEIDSEPYYKRFVNVIKIEWC